MRELTTTAIKAAIGAGEKILAIYNDPNSDFEVERKADNSPLTKADKAAHIEIVKHLEPLGVPILSEEGRNIPYDERKGWSRLWIVDPLDGTKEFISKNGEFTVNIALVEDGAPIFGVIYVPVTGELYYGEAGKGAYKVIDSKEVSLPIAPKSTSKEDAYTVVASRSHLSAETSAFIDSLRSEHPNIEMVSKGSSLKICMVAEGVADIYPRFAPTMEWDTAAGDAILRAAGGGLTLSDGSQRALAYNKEDLLNPYFIAQ